MWSAVSFAKRLATIMHRVRHANGLGRFALVASSAKTRLLAFVPSVVHLWVLRLAIQLPGINPTLADTIRQYVNGQTTFHATQASFAAPMAADTSKVVNGPLCKQPSAMSSFLRNVALAPTRCDANDRGQRSPMVNGAQDITERPPVFFLPPKHVQGSPDVSVRPIQAQKTRPTRDFVPWLARKPHSFTPHEVDPTCFHNSPLAGTYFAGGSSEHDADTQCHNINDVEPTCFSNSSLAGTSSSGHHDSQPYGTLDKVPSSEDVTQRLCDLKAPLDPHLVTIVHSEDALPEDDDDDKPFYILEEFSKCRQALFEYQRRLSPELYSSSENTSSGAEDEGLDWESDKENVPPLVRSTVESPTSIANYSPGYDPLFTPDLASRLGDGPSVASRVSGAALLFDDTGYAATDRQSASSQTSEVAYGALRDTRLPLVDLALSPASSTDSATTRVADDDNLGFGGDLGSDGSSPLPGPATVSLYERAYLPPSDAVFLQFGTQMSYVVKLLGAGAYGRAYLAMFRQGPAVVKVVSKRHAYGRYGEAGRQLALKELNTWKVVTESDKPFLARLMGSHDDPENIYYLMRLHNQTLGARMRHGETLTLEEVQLYSAQLISALVSLQELGIMHMDIKPDNIHITPDGDLALADFGCSHRPPVRRGRKPIDWQNRRIFTPAGTAGYWAPEVRAMNPLRGIRPACDVYSTGIVILEMALGERNMFFAPMTPGEEAINEQMRTKPIPFEHISAIDTDLGDMLRQMLCDSPNDRATPAALKAHPYVADLFERGLETGHVKPYYLPCSPWDPYERPSVDMEDFREPFADLAGNPAATEAAHAQYLDLSARDDTTKPYDYSCPTQYWSLASHGWPIPTP